jgi:uncharacterized membrane protein
MEVNIMTLLVLGVLVWSLTHVMPTIGAGTRSSLVRLAGESAYKGIAGLLIIAAIALMVTGWRSLPQEFIYELPAWADLVCGLAMLATSVLFFAPYMQTNISRFLRHPQLAGVIFWGLGHVLASGQVRSLLLFGGLSAWALIEILLINRRDGAWQRPGPASLKADFKLLLAGLGFFLLFALIHDSVFGVSVIPG